MKLICLNAWGGKLLDPLLGFIASHAHDTDVFCFQEIFDIDASITPVPILEGGCHADLYSRISAALPGFRGYFDLRREGVFMRTKVDFPLQTGLAIFVRETIPVRQMGSSVVVPEDAPGMSDRWPFMTPRMVQYAVLDLPAGPIAIANYHGLIDDGQKRDTPARIRQFELVRDLVHALPYRAVLCGDFNVYPNTESIRLFEEAGMRDLIREFAVPTTRNDNYPGVKEFDDYISDYLFTAGNVAVKDFRVLLDTVSDHLALALEFE